MNQDWSKWGTWLNGLIGGGINAAANSVTLIIVDPEKFSPASTGGWKGFLTAVVVSFGFGAALYLKTHPTPYDSTTLSLTQTAQPGQPVVTKATVETTHIEPK